MTVEYIDPWSSDYDGWPNDTDAMKKIDAVMENGGIILDGLLLVDDYGFDGEDEYPIFVVEDSQGKEHSFAEVVKYRFV